MPAFPGLYRVLRLPAFALGAGNDLLTVRESDPVMRPVQSIVFVAIAACIAWPATTAYSTGVMTPKRAALQGLTAT